MGRPGLRTFAVAETNPDKRSLLYMGAFCVLALSFDAVSLAAPRAEVARGAEFWLLLLLSTVTGLTALWLRRTSGPAERAAAPRPSSARTVRLEEAKTSTALDDLATWRAVRASRLERPLSPRLRPAPPPPPPPAPVVEEPTALDDLGAWRSRRAQGFAEHKLDLPQMPDAPAAHAGDRGKKKAGKEKKAAFDPWAKVLEDFDSRERGPK